VAYTRGKVPGNFLGETQDTALTVIGPEAAQPNTNKVYYRVVAVDARGTLSGCSDYAEAPHPFLYTSPVTRAQAGRRYTYQVRSRRSLNDVQHHYDAPGDKLWDSEENAFTLVEGPKWLTLDGKTGVLSGTPQAGDAGTARVKLEVTNQFGGRAEQELALAVGR